MYMRALKSERIIFNFDILALCSKHMLDLTKPKSLNRIKHRCFILCNFIANSHVEN
jgi:hypothetical protein